jgi:hypothetical protein
VKANVAGSAGGIGFIKALEFHGDGSDGGVKALKIDGLTAADLSKLFRNVPIVNLLEMSPFCVGFSLECAVKRSPAV